MSSNFKKKQPQKPTSQEEEGLNEDLFTGYSRKMIKGRTTNIPKLSLVFCKKDLCEGKRWVLGEGGGMDTVLAKTGKV